MRAFNSSRCSTDILRYDCFSSQLVLFAVSGLSLERFRSHHKYKIEYKYDFGISKQSHFQGHCCSKLLLSRSQGSISLFNVMILSTPSRSDWLYSGARFSKVPKIFRAQKATRKILNLKFTELFISHNFNTNKVSFHAKFNAYTLLFF